MAAIQNLNLSEDCQDVIWLKSTFGANFTNALKQSVLSMSLVEIDRQDISAVKVESVIPSFTLPINLKIWLYTKAQLELGAIIHIYILLLIKIDLNCILILFLFLIVFNFLCMYNIGISIILVRRHQKVSRVPYAKGFGATKLRSVIRDTKLSCIRQTNTREELKNTINKTIISRL